MFLSTYHKNSKTNILAHRKSVRKRSTTSLYCTYIHTSIRFIIYKCICNISFLCKICSVPHFSFLLYINVLFLSLMPFSDFFFRLLFWNSNLFHQLIHELIRAFLYSSSPTLLVPSTHFQSARSNNLFPPLHHHLFYFFFVFSFPIFTFNHNEWVLCLLHTFIFVNINKKNGKKSIRDSKSMALLHTMCLNVNQQKQKKRRKSKNWEKEKKEEEKDEKEGEE